MQIENPDLSPQVIEEDSGADAPEETSGSSSEVAEDISEDSDVPEEASEVSLFPFYGELIADDSSTVSSAETQVEYSVMTQQLEVTNCLLIIIVLLLLIKLISNIMSTLFKS